MPASLVLAAALACKTTTPFPDLVQRVFADGEKLIREEIVDQLVQVPAAVKSKYIPAEQAGDGAHHFFEVLVGKKDEKSEELVPTGVLLSSMADKGGRRERWLLLLGLDGKLQKALLAWDEIDEEGKFREGGKSTQTKLKGPFDPDVRARLDHELKIHCVRRSLLSAS